MTEVKKNKEIMEEFTSELDELLKKYKVSLYSVDKETGEENTDIYAFSRDVFDTGLVDANYGGFY